MKKLALAKTEVVGGRAGRIAIFLCAMAFAGILAGSGAAQAQQRAELVQRSALRVCADPANMPFSDKKREGFENKIADLLGKSLNIPVVYTWFPQATGFLRRTLRAFKCDIVMGYVQGFELVQNTNPYYRSAYVLIYPKGGDLKGVTRLGDARLVTKRLGVIAGTPPATILALNSMIANAKPYQLMVDRRYESPAEEMIADLNAGKIDAGLLWGPIAGYYAKKSKTPLAIVPLVNERKGPRMTYRITMGIRPGETEWKHRLNRFLSKHKHEINAILLSYNVPLLDEQDQPVTTP